MRAIILLAIACAFLAPKSALAYDGSFTNVYQYQAWINDQASAAKRKYVRKKRHVKRYSRRAAVAGYSGGASLGGIVSTLQARCGAKVISALRPGSKTPFGVASCHSTGQAVDMTGNYACMYSVLRSWPGGYTLDSGRCRHIHISSCKMEWGMRFNHKTC
jgi:hypothetical protein